MRQGTGPDWVKARPATKFEREPIDAVRLAPQHRPAVRARVVIVGRAVEAVLTELVVRALRTKNGAAEERVGDPWISGHRTAVSRQRRVLVRVRIRRV